MVEQNVRFKGIYICRFTCSFFSYTGVWFTGALKTSSLYGEGIKQQQFPSTRSCNLLRPWIVSRVSLALMPHAVVVPCPWAGSNKPVLWLVKHSSARTWSLPSYAATATSPATMPPAAAAVCGWEAGRQTPRVTWKEKVNCRRVHRLRQSCHDDTREDGGFCVGPRYWTWGGWCSCLFGQGMLLEVGVRRDQDDDWPNPAGDGAGGARWPEAVACRAGRNCGAWWPVRNDNLITTAGRSSV